LESPSFHSSDENDINSVNGDGGGRGGEDSNSGLGGWSIASLFSLTSSWANPSSNSKAASSSENQQDQLMMMTAGKPKECTYMEELDVVNLLYGSLLQFITGQSSGMQKQNNA
jgi:hypothetical protein